MTAPTGSGDTSKVRGVAYKDKSKPADVRKSNISAAKGNWKFWNILFFNEISPGINYFFKVPYECIGFVVLLQVISFLRLVLFSAVSDAVRTSLGPRGMDKMVHKWT